MPALMKASPYITAHYRSGIHASNIAWTVLIRYRGDVFTVSFTPDIIDRWVGILAAAQVGHQHSVRFASPTGRSDSLSWLSILYSQYSQLIVGILVAPQVSHCLRAAFRSHRRRKGQTPSADWGSLPSYLSVGVSLQNLKGWLCLKVRFDKKVKCWKSDINKPSVDSHLVTPLNSHRALHSMHNP